MLKKALLTATVMLSICSIGIAASIDGTDTLKLRQISHNKFQVYSDSGELVNVQVEDRALSRLRPGDLENFIAGLDPSETDVTLMNVSRLTTSGNESAEEDCDVNGPLAEPEEGTIIFGG